MILTLFVVTLLSTVTTCGSVMPRSLLCVCIQGTNVPARASPSASAPVVGVVNMPECYTFIYPGASGDYPSWVQIENVKGRNAWVEIAHVRPGNGSVCPLSTSGKPVCNWNISNVQALACELLHAADKGNITLLKHHCVSDNANAYTNVRDMCNGIATSTSTLRIQSITQQQLENASVWSRGWTTGCLIRHSCNNCQTNGHSVCLDANLIFFLFQLKLELGYYYISVRRDVGAAIQKLLSSIRCDGHIVVGGFKHEFSSNVEDIAGGCHSCSSKHYIGRAVSFYMNDTFKESKVMTKLCEHFWGSAFTNGNYFQCQFKRSYIDTATPGGLVGKRIADVIPDSSDVVRAPACTDPNATMYACKLICLAKSKKIVLWKTHLDRSIHDNAFAYSNIQDACNGVAAKRSNYTCHECKHNGAPGDYVCLNATILQYIYDLYQKLLKTTGKGYIHVNEIAGACHSCNSKHYLGRAVDIHFNYTMPNNLNASMIELCNNMTGTGIDEKNHVHCQF